MKRAICIVLTICSAIVFAAAQQGSSTSQAPAATTQSGATQSGATQPKGGNSASDLAAAKAAHKVWVNLDTGIYHKGGRWYGKTKNGKFMTVDDAKKAGYKAAKRD
jgi:uncharacterized protein YdeI (BOF family)